MDRHAFEPRLEHAFTISIDLAEPYWIQPSSRGEIRAAVHAAAGSVEGPRLNGRVIPMSGGDFPLVRPNGVIDFDARYLLEADDGAIIYLENRGYRWARSPEIAERMARNEPVGPDDYYMRVTSAVRRARRPARMDGEARLRRRRREDPEGQPHPLFRGALNCRDRSASARSCGPASTRRARRTSRRCPRSPTTFATSTAWRSSATSRSRCATAP